MSDGAITRRLHSGTLIRVFPGVFRLAGAPTSLRQQLIAAVLWAGPSAAVSHRAAAHLWKLNGLEGEWLELTSPKPLKPPDGLRVHTADIKQVVTMDCFRVTSVSRTLFDLGKVVGAEVVETALEDALRRELTNLPKLRRILAEEGVNGRKSARVLREILDYRGGKPVAESPLETKIERILIGSGLPNPVRQFEVREGRRVVARIDLAYPDQLVAIEADGYRDHSGRREWSRDQSRHNELSSRGWIILRFTWEDVSGRKEEIASRVTRALRTSPARRDQ